MKPELVPDFDLSRTDFPEYWRAAGNAVILGADGRIILQQRDAEAPTAPNMIACPGGGHEDNETLLTTAVRELGEELEIEIDPAEMVFLGATKRMYKKMTVWGFIARFFWHDKAGRVTHTTEGDLAYFDNASQALASDKLTFSTRWAIEECLRRGLIK